MALEFLADPSERNAYPVPLREDPDGPAVLDWRPMLAAILEDRRRGVAPERIAARFHEGLAAGIVAMARRVGEAAVALTGGCFQNRRLLAAAAERLEGAGFRVLLHRRVPPNDGGIGLGQILIAARRVESGTVPERGLQV
jgi:hydrogenase maturation protein HypF